MTSDPGQGHEWYIEEEHATRGVDEGGRRADPHGGSSRVSLAGAGWTCRDVGEFGRLVPSKGRSFSWLTLAPLWQSRNQVLESLFGDPTDDERRRWMEIQQSTGKLPADLLIKEHVEREKVSFIVVGDTGEGDASQFAVVPPLLACGRDTDFMVICSDVIYPAGDINQYEDKFYRPYRDYPGPIYALLGNHDWYDGLNGFMFHLCEAHVPALASLRKPRSWKERVRQLLWRKPDNMDPTVPARRKAWRARQGQQSSQRAPYFAIETGPLLIVGLDTGISGDIDRGQGEWLGKISQIDKPKLLLTGKPIYVDGEYHPGMIEDGGTVDEVVRAPEHNYVAAIGGDIHNYQRYPVRLGDGRRSNTSSLAAGARI